MGRCRALLLAANKRLASTNIRSFPNRNRFSASIDVSYNAITQAHDTPPIATMEAPAAFRFPPPRDANPLQSLSPERVNNTATRAPSGLSSSTAATKSSRTTADADVFYPDPSSAHSSPTRRVANLFSDYHPRSPSPNKTNGFALPQSPSLPEINALRGHVRTNSDVQGLVKRFEVLDVRDKDAEAGERRRKHEAELGRAVMAREEAESDVRKLREEMRRMRKEGEEGRDRERRVSRRLEMLMVRLYVKYMFDDTADMCCRKNTLR